MVTTGKTNPPAITLSRDNQSAELVLSIDARRAPPTA
jgi:hypothetical protein